MHRTTLPALVCATVALAANAAFPCSLVPPPVIAPPPPAGAEFDLPPLDVRSVPSANTVPASSALWFRFAADGFLENHAFELEAGGEPIRFERRDDAPVVELIPTDALPVGETLRVRIFFVHPDAPERPALRLERTLDIIDADRTNPTTNDPLSFDVNHRPFRAADPAACVPSDVPEHFSISLPLPQWEDEDIVETRLIAIDDDGDERIENRVIPLPGVDVTRFVSTRTEPGTYRYRFEGRDSSGNIGVSEELVVDVRPFAGGCSSATSSTLPFGALFALLFIAARSRSGGRSPRSSKS